MSIFLVAVLEFSYSQREHPKFVAITLSLLKMRILGFQHPKRISEFQEELLFELNYAADISSLTLFLYMRDPPSMEGDAGFDSECALLLALSRSTG